MKEGNDLMLPHILLLPQEVLVSVKSRLSSLSLDCSLKGKTTVAGRHITFICVPLIKILCNNICINHSFINISQ